MHPLRFEAALALAALSRTALSLPAKLLELTLDSLDSAHVALIEGATDNSSAPSPERRAATRTRMFPLHGFGATASLLLLALPGHRLGVPPALLERAGNSSVTNWATIRAHLRAWCTLTCTRAGWTLAAALAALRPHTARSSSAKATTSVAAADQEHLVLACAVRLWGESLQGRRREYRGRSANRHTSSALGGSTVSSDFLHSFEHPFRHRSLPSLQRVVYWPTAVQKLTQTGWVSSPAKPRGQATLLRIRTLLMEVLPVAPVVIRGATPASSAHGN